MCCNNLEEENYLLIFLLNKYQSMFVNLLKINDAKAIAIKIATSLKLYYFENTLN